jgi:hypothetical protein
MGRICGMRERDEKDIQMLVKNSERKRPLLYQEQMENQY